MRLLVLGGALLALLSSSPAFARDRAPVASHGLAGAELRLTVEPRHLVLRRTHTATFHLVLPEGDEVPKPVGPVRVAVNSGTVNDPVLEADGRYRIDYVLPDLGYPHHALLLVSVPFPSGETIAAFQIPLSGIARVMVDTIPGARVYGEIAGRRSGPFTADARGEVELRLPARPGETTATIRAKDASGAARGRTMQLPAPPQNRLVALPQQTDPESPAVGGFWLFNRGNKASQQRLQIEATPGGELQAEFLEGGLSQVPPPGLDPAGWESILVQVRVRKDPISKADLSLAVPSILRGPGLLLLTTEKGAPEGLETALREAGVRPRFFATTEPFSDKAGRLLVEKAEAAAAWVEGDPPSAVLVMARPGGTGMVEERFEAKAGDPKERWSLLARKLREALRHPPKALPPPEPDPPPEPEEPPPELPPLPMPTTAVCETSALPWWPHEAFALRFGLSPKVALGGGGLGGNFAVGAEYRSHLALAHRPYWLADLRVLTGASLSIDSSERIVSEVLGIWLRGRYLLLDVAALLPFESRFSRLLLVGPRLALRLGQLKMKPVVPDGYLAPASQFAADLSLGAEARFRLPRVEVGTGLGLEFPLTRFSVLPQSSMRLLQRQVRLRLDLRVSFSF